MQVPLQNADCHTIELQAQVVVPLDKVTDTHEERLERGSDHFLLVVATCRNGHLVQEDYFPSLLVD
jgi:hypothetical protein